MYLSNNILILQMNSFFLKIKNKIRPVYITGKERHSAAFTIKRGEIN